MSSHATAHLVFGWHLGDPDRWHIAEVDDDEEWTTEARPDLADDFQEAATNILLANMASFTETDPHPDIYEGGPEDYRASQVWLEQLRSTPEYRAHSDWVDRRADAIKNLPVEVEAFGVPEYGVQTYFLIAKSVGLEADACTSKRILISDLASYASHGGPQATALLAAAEALGITPVRPTQYGEERGPAAAPAWLLTASYG